MIYPEYEKEMRLKARGDQVDGSCDGANIAEIAGRECYDSLGRGRDSTGFHKNIIESKHLNVWRHAVWTFEISECSRNFTHELVRHSVGTAPSMRSTRYVDESDYKLAPHTVLDDIISRSDILKSMLEEVDTLTHKLYSQIVELGDEFGYSRKASRGAAARILPNGIETALVWSMNGNAVLNILSQRLSYHADCEIREFAEWLLEFFKKECPELVYGIDDLGVDTSS
jgi:thymidylate synthase (FAD)